MTVLQSIAALCLLTAACMGFGGAALTLFGARDRLRPGSEWIAFSFVVGTGLFGWIAFFPGVAGWFDPALFWTIDAIGLALLAADRKRFALNPALPPAGTAAVGLALALAAALLFDVLEGLSPPADADTLAYHFALPKQFLEAGRIEFVPRAVSGAIPLLVHMTYGAALATGGELALTLWTMLTGWAVVLLLYVILQRHELGIWAAAAAVALLTCPALLYGGGTGQVEIRGAGFVLAAGVLIADGLRANSMRLLVLAGLCTGFFIATKFFGLFFAAAAGLPLVLRRGGIRNGLLFGGAAVIAGFQWYLWNWIHTSDPLFPFFTNLLGYPDSPFWSREFGTYFSNILAQGELPMRSTITNWIAYPVLSTFGLVPGLEGGRTGLGLLAFIVLPLIAGAPGDKLLRFEFALPILIAALFFTVWFFSGTTQRTRHLLSIYPLLIAGAFPLAVFGARRFGLGLPLAAGLCGVLAIQLAGHAVFTVNFARYVFTHETKAAFLARNVPGADSAAWVNANLPAGGKVAFMNRQQAYLIDVPAFMLHPYIQILVDARPTSHDERKFVDGLKRQNITHILIPDVDEKANEKSPLPIPYYAMISRLVSAGCLMRIRSFDAPQFQSRTLRQFGGKETASRDGLFRVSYSHCPAAP